MAMCKLHRDVLQWHRVFLMENVMFEELKPYLVEKGVFNDDMIDAIASEKTINAQNSRLLANLPKRGEFAFNLFCEALDDTNQGFVSEALRKAVVQAESAMDTKSTSYTAGGRIVGQVGGYSMTDQRAPAKSKPIININSAKNLQVGDGCVMNVSSGSGCRQNLTMEYKMNSMPRGYALVIVNKKFEKHGDRHGADVDAKNLLSLCEYLGYRVQYKENRTSSEIKEDVNSFATADELKNVDSVILVISSHGENGQIFGVDSEKVGVEDLVGEFNGPKCRHLIGKPKFIIIQACRGNQVDVGVDCEDSGDAEPSAENLAQYFQELSLKDAQDIKSSLQEKLPSAADMIVAYSTVPGQVSWRNSMHGSWFIKVLCDTIHRHGSSEHALDMLVMVNAAMAERAFHEEKKQIPQPFFTLRKKLFFYPPGSTY